MAKAIEEQLLHCNSCNKSTKHLRNTNKTSGIMMLLHVVLTIFTWGVWLLLLLCWLILTTKIGGWKCGECGSSKSGNGSSVLKLLPVSFAVFFVLYLVFDVNSRIFPDLVPTDSDSPSGSGVVVDNQTKKDGAAYSNDQESGATNSGAVPKASEETERDKERALKSRMGDLAYAAKKAVKQKLKDPDSAKFQNIQFLTTSEYGDVIVGQVNSKNSFNAYAGFQKFISDGKTTILESENENFAALHQKLISADITKRTLDKLPKASKQTVPIVFDIRGISRKSELEVDQILGSSDMQQTNLGIKKSYKGGQIEIIFSGNRIYRMDINELGSIPFTPDAIKSLGLDASAPTFASEFVMRWNNIPGYSEVTITRGQKNCDWASVKP